MKKVFTTKRICRAGIIAALYVALTYAFGAIAYQGFLEIRPSEALCILPLFFPEAVPALYVGCMLGNIASPYWIYDVFVGSLATLVAALGTYTVGRLIRESAKKAGQGLRVFSGGLFPVLVNAFVIPVIIVFLCGDVSAGSTPLIAYWVLVGSLCATEALWVYALGTPLYLTILRMRKKGVSAFLDKKPELASEPVPQKAHT